MTSQGYDMREGRPKQNGGSQFRDDRPPIRSGGRSRPHSMDSSMFEKLSNGDRLVPFHYHGNKIMKLIIIASACKCEE